MIESQVLPLPTQGAKRPARKLGSSSRLGSIAEPGERKMTPPIPEWILSAGSRTSLSGYNSRKLKIMVGARSGDEDGDDVGPSGSTAPLTPTRH